MGVSKNSGFSPQIIHFNRGFHYKPSILGGNNPIFGNTPYNGSFLNLRYVKTIRSKNGGGPRQQKSPLLLSTWKPLLGSYFISKIFWGRGEASVTARNPSLEDDIPLFQGWFLASIVGFFRGSISDLNHFPWNYRKNHMIFIGPSPYHSIFNPWLPHLPDPFFWPLAMVTTLPPAAEGTGGPAGSADSSDASSLELEELEEALPPSPTLPKIDIAPENRSS